jgi:hypothetical protein
LSSGKIFLNPVNLFPDLRTRLTHLNFFSFYFNRFNEHAFRIRGGGEAASLLAKPAASGDAFASPRGGRKKVRPPWDLRRPRLDKPDNLGVFQDFHPRTGYMP